MLVGDLLASQLLNGAAEHGIRVGTMLALAFIMIHVGYEFEID